MYWSSIDARRTSLLPIAQQKKQISHDNGFFAHYYEHRPHFTSKKRISIVVPPCFGLCVCMCIIYGND